MKNATIQYRKGFQRIETNGLKGMSNTLINENQLQCNFHAI